MKYEVYIIKYEFIGKTFNYPEIPVGKHGKHPIF